MSTDGTWVPDSCTLPTPEIPCGDVRVPDAHAAVLDRLATRATAATG